MEKIDLIVKKAINDSGKKLSDIDAIASTAGPGLVVCLHVGFNIGKSIAAFGNKLFFPINHLEGHALSPSIENKISFPYLLLLISGGHSHYLIVKGENGLNEISNYLNSSNQYVEEINCYKRFKLESYENVRNEFYDADAIIFPSTYAFKIFFEEIYSTKVKAKLFGISKRIIDYISSYDLDSDFIDYFSKDIRESIKDSI